MFKYDTLQKMDACTNNGYAWENKTFHEILSAVHVKRYNNDNIS